MLVSCRQLSTCFTRMAPGKGGKNTTSKNMSKTKVVWTGMIGLTIVMATFFYIRFSAVSGVEAQTKSASHQSLDKIIQSLKSLDTAYASGNTAEAQSDFDNANNEWKSLSSKISARERREVQGSLNRSRQS